MRAKEFIYERSLKQRVADEDYDPNGPPPGPEFKPTMPKGTVKVDVSDVYDWYKLGQHISNLKGLGKHDFGSGPPSTIMAFGDEDTEHKYIDALQKTGLTTTDIDPVDPNQPKGMKRQKVDPTYNVNEYDESVSDPKKDPDAYKAYLLKTLPFIMSFLQKVIKDWRPTEEQMLDAIDIAYEAMKVTGDVKVAGKAFQDHLLKLHKVSQGLTEGSENNTTAQKIFFARSNLAPKGWSYDHVGFITQDGKQIQMSGHKGDEVYVTNSVTDDPEFSNQTIKVVSLPKAVSVPITNTVGAENCGTFVANVLQANAIKGFDTQRLYAVMKKPLEQGVAEDTVDEMALAKYQTFGDFDKPGPFRGADKKLVPHPKNIEKATKFFEQTPYDFRLFFSNVPGTGKYSEHGPMSPEQIKQIFGEQASEIIDGSEDAITVVYVGNKGDSKVMLTPWMMAHRFGHAIQAGARNKNWHAWAEAEKYFFQKINFFIKEHYSKEDKEENKGGYYTRNSEFKRDLTPEYNALFNYIGTQRSSTSGKIKRPYEYMYEMLAQYIGTGKVAFNPLPTNLGYGRRVFGNPTKYLNIKPEYRDEAERKQEADSLAYTMELLFNDVLSDSVGKIFVM